MNEVIMNRIGGLLSLSAKAGKIALGEEKVTEVIRNKKAYLILLATDASENTVKKFSNMATYRDLPLILLFDRYHLGNLIGKKFSVSAAITDKGFAESIMKLYKM